MATITDVGFIAKIKDGKKGFEVYLAGGMGAKPRLGFKFSDFLPEGEVFILAQAAKQVYDRLGDRKVKARARFRFVAEKLGEAELARIVENEMQLVREKFDCSLDLEDSPKLPILGESSLPNLTKEQEIWWKRFVIPQKQEGYFCAKVPLKLGDLSAHHARELAQTIAPFDNHSIYFAPNQNLYLRNLSAKNLLILYDLICAISSQSQKPTIIGDMVACTGAATCQLGIARPRGAIEAIEDFLADKNLNLDALQGFRIQLSGCPNSCANHFSANLGFFGKAKKFNGHSYPAYNVVLGGIVSADSENPSRFARKVAEIPAFHLPKFVALVLELYIAKKPKYPRFEDFVDSEGEGEIVAIAEGLQEIPDFSESTAPYYDFHSDKLFEETYKERGIGEEHFKEIKQN